MKAITWWLYYYGTLAGFLLAAEVIVQRETGYFFNPINQPYITLPLMVLTAVLLVVPTVYYKFIKPQLEWEKLEKAENQKNQDNQRNTEP